MTGLLDGVLTQAQERELRAIERKDPDALIVGWDHHEMGPIVLFSDGRRHIVDVTGELRKDLWSS